MIRQRAFTEIELRRLKEALSSDGFGIFLGLIDAEIALKQQKDAESHLAHGPGYRETNGSKQALRDIEEDIALRQLLNRFLERIAKDEIKPIENHANRRD